jgi:hypothetical protein
MEWAAIVTMSDIRVSFDEMCPGMEPRVMQFEQSPALQSIVIVDGVKYRVKEGQL